jgi:hypothetical protein
VRSGGASFSCDGFVHHFISRVLTFLSFLHSSPSLQSFVQRVVPSLRSLLSTRAHALRC